MTDLPPGVSSHFVQVGQIRTHYLEAGVGRGPTVLLIHSGEFGGRAEFSSRDNIAQLGEHFHVYAPDLAGFGRTDLVYSFSDALGFRLKHIDAFLRILCLGPVHLIGNSFGGGLALALAAAHPERVDRLVLMGSAGYPFEITPGLDAVWGYEPSPERMRELIGLFAHDDSIVTDDLVRLRYEASIRPGYQESYASMFPAPRQRHVEAMAQSEETLRALDRETLIVHGRDDRIIPLDSSIALHRLIPRSQLHVFGRCGHWTQIEQNDRFCRLIADFFAE